MRTVRIVATAAMLSLATGAWAAPSGGKAERAGEREVQAQLPQSRAPLWATLRKTVVKEDVRRGTYTAAFPPEVKALAGRPVTLSGFILPLDASARSKHFLLSKYTPICFFCPPGEPNEVVEVTVRNGVAITDRMVSVTGRMSLVNEAEQGLFFRIADAAVR